MKKAISVLGLVFLSFHAFGQNPVPLLTYVGKPEEKGDLKTMNDLNFGVDVKYYAGKVTFIQMVKVKGNVKTNASGTVNFS